MTSGADFGAPLFDDEESKILEDTELKEAEFRYLLQVWNTEGVMLYERKLTKIPLGWGLTEQRFFYREDDTDKKYSSVYMLETSGQSANIHKFVLPDTVSQSITS